MPFLQINDTQFPLRSGEMTLGGGDSDVRVPGAEGILARIQLHDDLHVAIRRVHPSAPIRINGVMLGTEPSPLIHGDKILAGTAEILFGDDTKQAGGTKVISNLAIPPELLKRARAGAPAKPTAATGGRLVSLVDGREFQVKPTGLTLGRDAACDVVLPGTDISRNHAELAVSPEGYYIIDLSTNGVFVNGEKVEGTRTLGRGDVIRIGDEEFRFYADVPAQTAAPVPAAAARAAPIEPPVPSPTAPPGRPSGPRRGEPTAPPMRAAPAQRDPGAGAKPVLATLEIINEGPNKGRRFELHTALSHVGRGPHNDVVIQDDSVSDTHAKIQRRDTGWFIVDIGSTNGTYVGGKRIAAETPLTGAPDVRFGGVKLTFRPTAEGAVAGGSTRAIAGVSADQARRMSATAASKAREAEQSGPPRKGVPIAVWIAIVLVIVAAVAFFMVGR